MVFAGLAFRLWSQMCSPSALTNTAAAKIASEQEAASAIEPELSESTDPQLTDLQSADQQSTDPQPALEATSEQPGAIADSGVENQMPQEAQQEMSTKPDDAVAAFGVEN